MLAYIGKPHVEPVAWMIQDIHERSNFDIKNFWGATNDKESPERQIEK